MRRTASKRAAGLLAVLCLLAALPWAAAANDTAVITYTPPEARESAMEPVIGQIEIEGTAFSYVETRRNTVERKEEQQISELVEVFSESKDFDAVLEQLPPEVAYSEDGYTGTLRLDFASVSISEGENKTSYFKLTETREYPHLTSNDPALVPKSITKSGRTYNLDGISWETQSSTAIDYQQIPSAYTAIATYTANGSSTTVTGYTITANYTGTVSRAIPSDVVYELHFATAEKIEQDRIAQEQGGAAAPGQSASVAPGQSAPGQNNAAAQDRADLSIVPVIITVGALALIGGGVVYFIRRRRNEGMMFNESDSADDV